jgi:hypothetical protein
MASAYLSISVDPKNSPKKFAAYSKKYNTPISPAFSVRKSANPYTSKKRNSITVYIIMVTTLKDSKSLKQRTNPQSAIPEP